MTETLKHRYSTESTRRELSNEYQHDRVEMVFKNLSVLVLWGKVASALRCLKGCLVARFEASLSHACVTIEHPQKHTSWLLFLIVHPPYFLLYFFFVCCSFSYMLLSPHLFLCLFVHPVFPAFCIPSPVEVRFLTGETGKALMLYSLLSVNQL